MWFLLKNIKFLNIFYTHVIVFYFVIIIISHLITKIPTPTTGFAISSSSPDSKENLTDLTNQVENNINSNPQISQNPPTANTINQYQSLNNDNFPSSSIPSAIPSLMSFTENIENQNQKTSIKNSNYVDPFEGTKTNLFDNDLSTTGSLKPIQIKGETGTNDQDLTENIENQNLITNKNSDYVDPFEGIETDLFENNLSTTGSLKPIKINGETGTNDQDLTENIENQNLITNKNSDYVDPFEGIETDLFENNLSTTGSLKPNQINGETGTNDQGFTEKVENQNQKTTTENSDFVDTFQGLETDLFENNLSTTGSVKPNQINGKTDTDDQGLTEKIKNQNSKIKNTDDNEEEDSFVNTQPDLFESDLSTSSSIKPNQINGKTDTDDQEKIKNQNLKIKNTNDNEEEDQLVDMQPNLFESDLSTSGSIKPDQNNGKTGTDDQDLTKNIDINDEDIYNNPELMENAKILEQMSQYSIEEQKSSKESMVGMSEDHLTEPTSLSDQETNIDNQGQNLSQEVTIDIINNVPHNESIGQNTNTNANTTSNIKKKRKKVPYKLEYKGEARVFCTFGTQVLKMFKKVKKYFIEGDLCHAVVYGVPLTIQERLIELSKDDRKELESIHKYKDITFLVVIMQYSSYETWSAALNTPKKIVGLIMGFLKKYRINGIQFTNLEPSPGDQLDPDMMCKLIIFFEMLLKETEAKNRKLKIGISISPYAQTFSTGFHSFEILNELVSWYSLHTISMVQCTPAYMKGTSPLNGTISLMSSFLELMKTDIRKNKVIISIQLYANKFGSLKAQSYVEMCLVEPQTWNKWCAARPEDFRLKGEFLRNLEIWGVQLYYMESDDYKALCDCYKFPMIRALLRGMAKKKQSKKECEYLGEVQNQPSKCSYENFLSDIDARAEREYYQSLKQGDNGSI